MGILDRLSNRKGLNLGVRGRLNNKKVEDEFKIDTGVTIESLEGNYAFIRSINTIEEYPVDTLNSYVKIVTIPKLGEGKQYFVEEAPLNEDEYNAFNKIMGILGKELEPPKNEDLTLDEYVLKQAEEVACKYVNSLGKFTIRNWGKIFYYVVRQLAGYGPLHAIFNDPNIEDISCNGLNTPIYVWHSKYESIPTNITFTDEQTANDFIIKLTHRSSKHISSAQPMLDAMLPEKHRLAATFMKEVSTRGSTFCIRKFRSDPFTVIDLIKRGTLNERIAAYFWLLLEHKMSSMVIGGTGAGKTSMLNAILSLMSQNDKIVTVEEVPELSPPLNNWTQLNCRQSFKFGSTAPASINIFDLVKMSLRYRPDYIVVGEIRGEEAYVLFQALATGHGGLCTMHADSLDNVVKRLTSPPMNVSQIYIPLMNSVVYVQKVELPQKQEGIGFGRRVRTIWEIEGFEQYREVENWKPNEDTFDTNFENSFHLKQMATTSGLTMKDVMKELDVREKYIQEMVKNDVRKQSEIAKEILSYYTKQREEKDAMMVSVAAKPSSSRSQKVTS